MPNSGCVPKEQSVIMTTGQFDVGDGCSGWMTRARYDDIDAQAAQLRGYGQHYVQLSRGRFEGRFASFFLREQLSLHFEQVNRVLAQSGRSPAGRYTACFLTADSPACRIDGVTFTVDDVALWPPGHDWDAVTHPGMQICVVDLEARMLCESGRLHTPAHVIRDPQAARRLREFVDDGLAQLRAHGEALCHDAATRTFASTLANMLPAPQALGDREHHWDTQIRARRCLRTFRQIRELIHEGLADGIDVADLSTQTGRSRRSIEYLFAALLETSPADYIRSLRLNGIRRALLCEDTSDRSVGDIAAQWGIWHWSRFAADYRKMFGELPSQTRRMVTNK
jgi:AraC family transcriptional regulator, ethanolamine operon transcriptional activator